MIGGCVCLREVASLGMFDKAALSNMASAAGRRQLKEKASGLPLTLPSLR